MQDTSLVCGDQTIHWVIQTPLTEEACMIWLDI